MGTRGRRDHGLRNRRLRLSGGSSTERIMRKKSDPPAERRTADGRMGSGDESCVPGRTGGVCIRWRLLICHHHVKDAGVRQVVEQALDGRCRCFCNEIKHAFDQGLCND